MSNHKTLAKKLSLNTETLRTLSTDELNSIAGGAGDSNQSICIGNGNDNQTQSVLGYCPTIRTAGPRPRPQPPRQGK